MPHDDAAQAPSGEGSQAGSAGLERPGRLQDGDGFWLWADRSLTAGQRDPGLPRCPAPASWGRAVVRMQATSEPHKHRQLCLLPSGPPDRSTGPGMELGYRAQARLLQDPTPRASFPGLVSSTCWSSLQPRCRPVPHPAPCRAVLLLQALPCPCSVGPRGQAGPCVAAAQLLRETPSAPAPSPAAATARADGPSRATCAGDGLGWAGQGCKRPRAARPTRGAGSGSTRVRAALPHLRSLSSSALLLLQPMLTRPRFNTASPRHGQRRQTAQGAAGSSFRTRLPRTDGAPRSSPGDIA